MDLLEKEKAEIEETLDGLRKGKARIVSFFSSCFASCSYSAIEMTGFVYFLEQGNKIAKKI